MDCFKKNSRTVGIALKYNPEVAWYLVVKHGGWILDCPGEDDRENILSQELVDRGWEWFYYKSKFGISLCFYKMACIGETKF